MTYLLIKDFYILTGLIYAQFTILKKDFPE